MNATAFARAGSITARTLIAMAAAQIIIAASAARLTAHVTEMSTGESGLLAGIGWIAGLLAVYIAIMAATEAARR